MANDGLTREFLAERDLRVFKMRQAGVAASEISKRLGMTTNAVHAAVRRQLERLNREALLAYPEVLRLELERLDTLQQAIWPMTQHRKVKMDDGSEVTVEPDLRAVQQVLSVMDRRSKLLGMEATQLNINVESAPQRASLAGAQQSQVSARFDPEAEARQLLELMGSAGVLPNETVQSLLGNPVGELAGVEDAEIIEEVVEEEYEDG
jgi:hypothetical protein